MTSYHVNRINGHGPYLRKATYIAPGEKEWTHIGAVHSVDPAQLPDETVAEIREEGYGLARFRDGQRSDVQRKAIANEVRDDLIQKFGEDVLADTDDRRLTEVELDEDAPRRAQRILENEAESMEAAVTQGAGQAELTEAEKKRIDFTKTSVMTARAAKAAIQEEGIDDWEAVWSEDLSTVSEARGAAKRNRESITGDRLDNDEGPDADSMSQRQATTEIEKNAIKYAREGDEDAAAALVDEFGWSEEELEMEMER